MRTLTTTQRQTLAGTQYRVSARVWVEDAAGTLRNLSTLGGLDWLDEIQWDEDIDQPVSQVTVRLWRETDTQSLAPLVEASPLNRANGAYTPLLEAGRELVVEVATTPVGAEAVAADWERVFHGEIDEVDWGGSSSKVSLVARDLGGRLLDRFIEAEKKYGTAEGVPVETVMQKILDDTLGAGAVVLYSPGGTPAAPFRADESPGWKIKEFKQEKEPLLEGLRKLAQQVGWDVRYRWNEGSAAFRLTFFEPGRANTAADWTFAPSSYLDVSSLRTSRAGVRNVVRVVYTDTADGKRKTEERTDAASISRYGRRFMELEEESSSLIDTAEEAGRLADSALSDLADPKAEQEIELHFFWPAELGDLYRFTANGVHYDTDQELATVGVRHQLTRDQQRTTIRVRGRVAGAYREWLRREIRVAGEAEFPPGSPILAPHAVLTASRDASDVYVQIRSDTGEFSRLHVMDDGVYGQWGLVKSDTDATPRYVAPNTTVGPESWFHDGTSFARKLAAIPLRRDQVRRVSLQGEAQNSGAHSAWVSLALNVREQPWLESVDLIWDETTDTLTMRAVGGAFCRSARIEVSTDESFATGVRGAVAALTDLGGNKPVASAAFALTAADRGRKWHGRVTPYNAPLRDTNADGTPDSPSGLAGQAQRDSEFVPASESGAGIQPPSADITFVSGSRTAETVRYAGALGAGGSGPLQWQRRIDSDVAQGTFGALSSTLPADETIQRDPFWTRYVLLRVVDAEGRQTVAEYPVAPSMEGVGTDGLVHALRDDQRNVSVTGEQASYGFRIWDVSDPLRLAASQAEYAAGVSVASLRPAQAGADVTGSNTAADTSRVAGTLAGVVRSDATVGRQSAAAVADSLLRNGGGQEDADGAPASGWVMASWSTAGSLLRTTTAQARLGDRSLVLDHPTPADAGAYQDLPVADGDVVEVSGWIRTTALAVADAGQGVAINTDRNAGVTRLVSLERTTVHTFTIHDPDGVDVGLPGDGVARDWTFVRSLFRVEGTGSIRVNLQLGYGGGQSGTAWFDGVSVRRRTRYEVEGAVRTFSLLDAEGLKDTAKVAGRAAFAVRDDAVAGRAGVGAQSDNTVINGGAQLDEPGALASGWAHVGYGMRVSNARAARFGDRCFVIDHPTLVESYAYQDVAVRDGDVWELGAWIASTALPPEDSGQGAIISVGYHAGVTGLDLLDRRTEVVVSNGDPASFGLPADGVARDWTFCGSMVRVRGTGLLRLHPVLGFYGQQRGTAWFDGIFAKRRTRYEVDGAARTFSLLDPDGLKDTTKVAGVPSLQVRNDAQTGRRGVGTEADNLIANGGGQDGVAGWLQRGGYQPAAVDTAVARFGDRSLTFAISTAVEGLVYQDYRVADGDVVEMAGWVKTTALAAAEPGQGAVLHNNIVYGVATLEMLERETGFVPINHNPYGVDVGLPADGVARDWTYVRSLFRVRGSGELRLHLVLGYGGYQNGQAWFDGITVRRHTRYQAEGRRRTDTFYGADAQLQPNVYTTNPYDGAVSSAGIGVRRAVEGLTHYDHTIGQGAAISRDAPLPRLLVLRDVDSATGRVATLAGRSAASIRDDAAYSRQATSTSPTDILWNGAGQNMDLAGWSHFGNAHVEVSTNDPRPGAGQTNIRIWGSQVDGGLYRDIQVIGRVTVEVTAWMKTGYNTSAGGVGAMVNIDPGDGSVITPIDRETLVTAPSVYDAMGVDVGMPNSNGLGWTRLRSTFVCDGGGYHWLRVHLHLGYGGPVSGEARYMVSARVLNDATRRAGQALDANARLTDQRRLNTVVSANSGSLQSTRAPITYYWNGWAYEVTVAAHYLKFGFGAISYPQAVVHISPGETWYFFFDDPGLTGGGVPFGMTQDPTAVVTDGRYFVGAVTVPYSTGGTGGGSGGGGGGDPWELQPVT